MNTPTQSDFEAASEAKWRELRATLGHYLSAWNPKLTQALDELNRAAVLEQMQVWAVGWFADRGLRVACRVQGGQLVVEQVL